MGEPSFLFSNCCELQRCSPFCSGESMEELEWDSGSVAPCIDLLACVGLAGRTLSLSFTSAPQPRAGACEGSSMRGPGRCRDCSIGSDPCPKQGAPGSSRVQREELVPTRGDRAPQPALSTNFSPSSSSVQEIYALWVQKRLLEGKRKERERKRMKMILIFFLA